MPVAPPQTALWVIGTPIGHLQDLTHRAVDVLRSLDLLLAEDTRVTGKLLSHYAVRVPMKSYNAYKERLPLNFDLLFRKYPHIGLVSNAGTPCISDPGVVLVRYCHQKKIPVIPIPGASALSTCLSIAGMASKGVLFLGFLPKKKRQRQHILHHALSSPLNEVIVLYESPYQLCTLLQIISDHDKHLEVFLGRELTKRHEEIFWSPVGVLLEELSLRPSIRGEVVIAVKTAKSSKKIH